MQAAPVLPGTVFPDDNRRQVSATNQPPFWWIGQLAIQFPNGTAGIGTGILIDSRHVLTCAHNLFQKQFGGLATSVDFTLALGSGGSPDDGPVHATHLYVTEEYRTQSPPYPVNVLPDDITWYTYDFGLVRLSRPLAPDRANFPPMIPLPPRVLGPNPVLIAGYPGDKPIGQMWVGDGPVMPVEHDNQELLFYRINTMNGQSGSPLLALFERPPDELVGIIGIHVAETTDFNFAVRVTDTVVETVLRWMNASGGALSDLQAAVV